MKKTVRENINAAYSLHDMHVIAFETEGGLTMRLDPIYAPKSMFTWEAIKGLFGALGNLLGSL